MCSRMRSRSGRRSWLEAVGVRLERRAAGLRVAVDDRELDLALVGVEVEEQLVDLVDDRLDPRVRPVDLVDDEDHGEPRLERLAQHEARLRQRPLARVDEEEHAVDHRQAALDLAAEVGVPGRVDDVDLRPAVADGRVLGEDRDALLALEVHRVEHALGDVLVRAESARLPEERVDERRLAVVDVGDDRDVAELGALRPWNERIGRSRGRRPGDQRRAVASSRPPATPRIEASTSSIGWSAGSGCCGAVERGRDLDEAARVRARVRLGARGEHVFCLAVAELARGLRLHDVVDAGRPAAEVLLGGLDDLERRDPAERRRATRAGASGRAGGGTSPAARPSSGAGVAAPAGASRRAARRRRAPSPRKPRRARRRAASRAPSGASRSPTCSRRRGRRRRRRRSVSARRPCPRRAARRARTARRSSPAAGRRPRSRRRRGRARSPR